MTDLLTIRRPDDWHVHLRDGIAISRVSPFTTTVFARALVMPNTTKPILTAEEALEYGGHIRHLAELHGGGFTPVMTIKLTPRTTPEMIRAAMDCHPHIVAGKLYPDGVTTNSEGGVSDFKAMWPTFAAMEEAGMVLCLHGELPGKSVLNAEADFIPVLMDIRGAFADLRIVVEHVSTQILAYMINSLPNIAATITVHHLVLTFNDVVGAKMHPDHFCKPVAKTEDDRQALVEMATSGNPKFFFGSDSAPHHHSSKYGPDVAAGVFSAPVALPLLAEVFERANALDKLENFVAKFGADFYGLPLNEGSLILHKEPWTVPQQLPDPGVAFIPFMAGRELAWRVDGQIL